VALEASKADSPFSATSLLSSSATRACILSGKFGQGKHHSKPSFVPEDWTPAELNEASGLFIAASQCDETNSGTFRSPAEQMLLCSRMRSFDLNRDVALPEVGSWVLVHGLVSLSGSAVNAKLGLISEDGPRNGRLVVTVDGTSEMKLIKTSNMIESPDQEKTFALVLCLETSAQWAVMRPIANRVRESLLASV